MTVGTSVSLSTCRCKWNEVTSINGGYEPGLAALESKSTRMESVKNRDKRINATRGIMTFHA